MALTPQTCGCGGVRREAMSGLRWASFAKFQRRQFGSAFCIYLRLTRQKSTAGTRCLLVAARYLHDWSWPFPLCKFDARNFHFLILKTHCLYLTLGKG